MKSTKLLYGHLSFVKRIHEVDESTLAYPTIIVPSDLGLCHNSVLKIGFGTFNRAWLLAQGTSSGEHLSRVLVLEAEHNRLPTGWNGNRMPYSGFLNDC
jgi:hypothetical protein